MTGLKPSFSVDFFVNENYFVSNIVVVLVGSKAAIVKQPKIVKRLINTGEINLQRSFGDRCIVSKLNSVANNANRFRYRRKKPSNHNGYWAFFIPFFQVKFNRYPKPKTAFGEDLN